MRTTLTLLALLALPLTLPASIARADGAADRLIHVSGSATVEAAPDVASISAGVVADGETAGQAMLANSKAMNAVFKAIEAAGVARKDFQTSQLSLNPVWDDRRNVPDGVRKIVGYRASNIVTVTVREVASLGKVIDQVTAAGANQIHSISFAIDDPQPLLDGARGDAVRDARRKADLYAKAAGVTVGPILSIREGGGSVPYEKYAARGAMAMDTPIAEGVVDLSAQVQVVFAIKH